MGQIPLQIPNPTPNQDHGLLFVLDGVVPDTTEVAVFHHTVMFVGAEDAHLVLLPGLSSREKKVIVGRGREVAAQLAGGNWHGCQLASCTQQPSVGLIQRVFGPMGLDYKGTDSL